MTTRYKGSVMSSTAATNSSTAATGVWRSNEVMQGLQGSVWPRYVPPSFTYLVVAGGGSGGSYDPGGGGAGTGQSYPGSNKGGHGGPGLVMIWY